MATRAEIEERGGRVYPYFEIVGDDGHGYEALSRVSSRLRDWNGHEVRFSGQNLWQQALIMDSQVIEWDFEDFLHVTEGHVEKNNLDQDQFLGRMVGFMDEIKKKKDAGMEDVMIIDVGKRNGGFMAMLTSVDGHIYVWRTRPDGRFDKGWTFSDNVLVVNPGDPVMVMVDGYSKGDKLKIFVPDE